MSTPAATSRTAPGARPRRPLPPADRLSLALGALLTTVVLGWLAWQLGAAVLRDRAVRPGVPPAGEEHGH